MLGAARFGAARREAPANIAAWSVIHPGIQVGHLGAASGSRRILPVTERPVRERYAVPESREPAVSSRKQRADALPS